MLPPFVSAESVVQHVDWKLVDVRFYLDGRSGREAYEAAHIPGAVYVDFPAVLSAPRDPDARTGRNPLPSPERFAAGLAAAGIGQDDVVIGYDDAGGLVAARLVWMLRAIGHEAALLDGGLAAWRATRLEGGAGPTPAPVKPFEPTPWPREYLATIDEVASFADARAAPADADEVVVLIDARPRDRYAGVPDDTDPRAGHIPGAHSAPARANVDEDGFIARPELLRERFAAVGIPAETSVVSYCGSGVTACHNLLAMEYAGLGGGRLYPGSWSEWSRDPDRPLETD